METLNTSMLTPNGFRLTIHSKEFRQFEYFCIGVELPNISLPPIEQHYHNEVQPIPGDTIEYSPFSTTFIVDEKLDNYNELNTWIQSNAHEKKPIWRDVTLSILTNQNASNKQIIFHNCFPTNLAGFEFNVQTSDVNYMTCTAEWSYANFEIKTIT